MKISHEVPVALLTKSKDFNDYDYALVHLFETNPDYYNFYKESIALGRSVVLDNSAFELGQAFDSDKFAHWITELQPTEYIIPDIIGNGNATANSVEEWINKYNLPGIKIGVVQGKTLDEFVECYNRIFPLVDKIAICFNYPFLVNDLGYNNIPISYDDETGDAITAKTIFSDYDQFKLAEYSMNRPLLVEYIRDNLPTKPTHLLGCSVPQEFMYYRDQVNVYNRPAFDFLESCDTSNPIVHAINGIKYQDYGLDNKISTKLIEYLNHDNFDMELIEHNVKLFRSFVK